MTSVTALYNEFFSGIVMDNNIHWLISFIKKHNHKITHFREFNCGESMYIKINNNLSCTIETRKLPSNIISCSVVITDDEFPHEEISLSSTGVSKQIYLINEIVCILNKKLES